MRSIKSMEEFYSRYMPNLGMKRAEESKLKTIHVCPKCESRNLHFVQHETYGYFLCYCCGWSSMPPKEIGAAAAKESCQKLKLEINLT